MVDRAHLRSAGVFIFYSAGNQVMAQRILGARSTWDGLMGIWWAGVINLIRPLITCFLGLLWKRTNRQGALFGLIGGSVLTLTMAFGAEAAGVNLHWLYLAAIAQAITMAGIVLVSLFTPPPEEQQWQPFHWTLSALAHYDSAPRPWFLHFLRVHAG